MNYYDQIKSELINNEINKKIGNYSINRNDLNAYYNVGKMLMEAGKHYGKGIINEYSKRLTEELGRGYSKRNLWLMLRFYEMKEKMQTVSAQLTWSHYCELLFIKSISEMNYYIKISIEQNLSVRELRQKVKNREYERLDENTKNKLINNEKQNIIDFVKNPILIKNSDNYQEISEKILRKIILEDMDNFLLELGDGFSYIGSEYKIKLGNSFNYIDLLLFNYEYNCFVVIELKVKELKKEHIGQIQVYMNHVDKTMRKANQDKTIGIIICKKDNKYVIEYCSDDRIIAREYKLV